MTKRNDESKARLIEKLLDNNVELNTTEIIGGLRRQGHNVNMKELLVILAKMKREGKILSVGLQSRRIFRKAVVWASHHVIPVIPGRGKS